MVYIYFNILIYVVCYTECYIVCYTASSVWGVKRDKTLKVSRIAPHSPFAACLPLLVDSTSLRHTAHRVQSKRSFALIFKLVTR